MSKVKKTLLVILPILIAVIMAIGFSLPCNFEKGQTEKVNNFVEAETGASTAPVSDKGGAIFLEPNTRYTMTGGTISGKSKKYGGAVFISKGATFEMTGGSITNNSATYGGGIYVQTGGTCRITGGSITGNTANYGPAIYIEDGATFELGSGATVDENEIEDEANRIEIGGEERVGHKYSDLYLKTVNFGSFPQHYVGTSLNSELESWYNDSKTPVKEYVINDSVTWKAYQYIDGNIYARGTENAYNNTEHKYSDGTVAVTGRIGWFKVEPIKWFILNYEAWQAGKENIELLSAIALASGVMFGSEYYDGYWHWSGSNMQTWLNSYFYSSAFSKAEKEFILLTENKNSLDEEYNKSPDQWIGKTTNDYIYCKSYYEMVNEPFPNSDDYAHERYCSPSDFTIGNGVMVYDIYDDNITCDWWTRTVLGSSLKACEVTGSYFAFDGGKFYFSDTYSGTNGTRPALHLSIKP